MLCSSVSVLVLFYIWKMEIEARIISKCKIPVLGVIVLALVDVFSEAFFSVEVPLATGQEKTMKEIQIYELNIV